jgi:hypothetical protein
MEPPSLPFVGYNTHFFCAEQSKPIPVTRRIRKSPGAPLVDSSLLRYISAQKESQFLDIGWSSSSSLSPTTMYSSSERSKGGTVTDACPSLISETTTINPYVPVLTATTTKRSPAAVDDVPALSSSIDSTPSYATTTSTSTSTTQSDWDTTQRSTSPDQPPMGRLVASSADDEYWLGQFNRHNLAQKLIALGADVNSAQLAGEAVQRYCLVRTTRRKIRIFLRERDVMWKDPTHSNGILLLSSPSYDDDNNEINDDGDNNDDDDDLETVNYVDASSIGDSRNANNNRPYPSTLVPSSSFTTTTTTSLSSSSSSVSVSVPSRCPSYGLDDVFHVMQEYGLTGGDICALLTNSPNLAMMMPRKSFLQRQQEGPPQGACDGDSVVDVDAGRSRVADEEADTLEETLQRSLNDLLIQTLGLRRYDARKVLRSCPGLLSVRGAKSAGQVMAMMSKLGVSEQSVARDKTSLPVLLSRSPAGIFRLISFLCSSTIRMPMNQVGPLLRRKDSRALMDAVIPIPFNVQQPRKDNNCPVDKINDRNDDDDGQTSLEECDDDDDPMAEAAFWSKTREERKQTIEQTYRNMTRTVLTLKNEIGTTDLGKVVSAYPSVLLLDAETQILPVARFLMEELGTLEGDLASVLQLYPMLLGLDIQDMKHVVYYLLSLGVEEDELPTILRAFPALLTFQIPTMEPVVSYLRSIGVEDIGAFITRLPPVLGYSVEKELAPKWEFLSTVCMHAKFEVRKFPAYFSYPFERVIKTRYEYLAYRGVSRQLIPVDAVLRFGDVDFAVKVAKDDDQGESYRSFTQQRHAAHKQRRTTQNGIVETSYNTEKKKKKKTKNPPTKRKSVEDGVGVVVVDVDDDDDDADRVLTDNETD